MCKCVVKGDLWETLHHTNRGLEAFSFIAVLFNQRLIADFALISGFYDDDPAPCLLVKWNQYTLSVRENPSALTDYADR